MSVLAVNNLCKSFGGLRVTCNVNLNVEQGERRLIIGPNGDGRVATLMPLSPLVRLIQR